MLWQVFGERTDTAFRLRSAGSNGIDAEGDIYLTPGVVTKRMGKIFVLGNDAIEELLRSALVGRIACCDHGISGGDGRPFLVPLAYGYDGESVYAFSSIGRKIRTMRVQPLVSFEVDDAQAEDRWSSVIADAVYEELTSEADRHRALEIIAKGGERPIVSREVVVYRLRITKKSGRFEIPDDEAHLFE